MAKKPFTQIPTWEGWECFSTINTNELYKNVQWQYMMVLSGGRLALRLQDRVPAVKTAIFLEFLVPAFRTEYALLPLIFKAVLYVHGY